MASSIPTINVSDYIARKSFDVWFVGKVQRVLNKQGKIRALLVDGSKVELDKNEYEYLGAKLPAKVTSPLTEEEFKAFKKGKAKEFLSSPTPTPTPAPTPTPSWGPPTSTPTPAPSWGPPTSTPTPAPTPTPSWGPPTPTPATPSVLPSSETNF